MTLYVNYSVVGKKEDVSDIIKNIAPTLTPFQQMIGTEKVKNTTFQWQEDTLAAVGDNAQLEGFTAASTARVPTVMRSGVTQILSKTISISDTVDSIAMYGRAKESAYQLGIISKELKRDLENALVGRGQQGTAPVDNATARKLTGFQGQVVAGNQTFTGAGPAAFNETSYLANLETLYNAGADPTHTMVTPSNSRIVAAFAAASGRNRDFTTGKTVVNAVNLYVSPFGETKIVMNRFLRALDTLNFNPSEWKLAVLRPWFRETLAKTGDSMQMMIVGEYGLKHSNRSASGIVREGTTLGLQA